MSSSCSTVTSFTLCLCVCVCFWPCPTQWAEPTLPSGSACFSLFWCGKSIPNTTSGGVDRSVPAVWEHALWAAQRFLWSRFEISEAVFERLPSDRSVSHQIYRLPISWFSLLAPSTRAAKEQLWITRLVASAGLSWQCGFHLLQALCCCSL